jgi:hypothetical protein
LVLCGIGLAAARGGAGADSVPPGAGSVRVDYYSMSHISINYDVPEGWALLDIYSYLSAQGWERDSTAERALQRPWNPDINRTFAIFVRQSLFGLVPEMAIVGLGPRNSQVHVRLLRCVKVDPRTSCP